MVNQTSKLFSFDRFSGMNNVDPSFRLPASRDNNWRLSSDMATIENLDIDNAMVLSTRLGSTLKISGSNIHSMWSDGDLDCLLVEHSILKRLTPQYSLITISEVGTNRMSYCKWNSRVYLTNEKIIGYVTDNTLTAIPSPTKNYKLPLPAGKFIAYYRAHLYVAKGKVLYISDALCDHYDIRTGFKIFSEDITMIQPVENGIYVGAGGIYFLKGDEPDAMNKDKVFDADAIPYTNRSLTGEVVGDGVQGQCALWTSSDGVCFGDGGGNVKNLTRARYSMSDYGIGGSVVRNINGTVHYITVLE